MKIRFDDELDPEPPLSQEHILRRDNMRLRVELVKVCNENAILRGKARQKGNRVRVQSEDAAGHDPVFSVLV